MTHYLVIVILLLTKLELILGSNNTTIHNEHDWDNATWVLTSSFIIITMQSGFGLLESGLVSEKNHIHIMIKNITDIIFGGLTFWIFGYAIIFGTNSNGFMSYQYFFTDKKDNFGWLFANFFFQFSFSTTATTIVSGCLAERTKFDAYILFSALNTIIYVFPAHWVWNSNGWLNNLGVIDFAGAGPVHLMGGLTGLVGTVLLKPRINRNIIPSSPVNAILGLFMLWWGWLGFNCGSTMGITEYKWLYASKAATTTVLASIGGGVIGIIYCMFFNNKYFSIDIIINSILGGLVAITPCCIYVYTSESLFIGIIGGLIAFKSNDYIKYLDIDDPVGGIGVHCCSSIWGLIASGLFTKNTHNLNINNGLFYGGGFYLLGIQILEIIIISLWTITISFFIFTLIDLTIGLRISEEQELLGADRIYHILNTNQQELDENTIETETDIESPDIENTIESPDIESPEKENNLELNDNIKMEEINHPNMIP